MEKIKIYVGGNIATLNQVCEKLTKMGYRYTGTTPARLNVNNDAVYAGGMHGPIISFRRFMPKYTFDAVEDGYRRVTVDELMRIECNEFKEFLDPSDWSLKLVGPYEVYPESWIEVPKGAITATIHDKKKHLLFWCEGKKHHCFNPRDNAGWFIGSIKLAEYLEYWPDSKVVWQRHTQPEPLPFIDDEPRPKPRKRVYAVLGKRSQPVRTVNMKLSIDSREFSEACKAAADTFRKAVKSLSEISRSK